MPNVGLQSFFSYDMQSAKKVPDINMVAVAETRDGQYSETPESAKDTRKKIHQRSLLYLTLMLNMAGQTDGPDAADQNRSVDDSSVNRSEFRGPFRPNFHVWLCCGRSLFSALTASYGDRYFLSEGHACAESCVFTPQLAFFANLSRDQEPMAGQLQRCRRYGWNSIASGKNCGIPKLCDNGRRLFCACGRAERLRRRCRLRSRVSQGLGHRDGDLCAGILLSPKIAGAAMAFSSVSVISNALRLRKIDI